MAIKVILISNISIQNNLLSDFINKSGYICQVYTEDLFSSLISQFQQDKDHTYLFFWDWQSNEEKKLWSYLENYCSNHGDSKYYLLVYNVSRDECIEKKALQKGAQGVFFDDYDLELFKKCIDVVSQGQLWFTRETMKDFILQRTINKGPQHQFDQARITEREKEILGLVALGINNAEIASFLGISLPTVKSHMSQICRKINVSNRLQAALWMVKVYPDRVDI